MILISFSLSVEVDLFSGKITGYTYETKRHTRPKRRPTYRQ